MQYYFHNFIIPPYGGRYGCAIGWIISEKDGDFAEWKGEGATFCNPHGDKYYINLSSEHVIFGRYLINSKMTDHPALLEIIEKYSKNPADFPGMNEYSPLTEEECKIVDEAKVRYEAENAAPKAALAVAAAAGVAAGAGGDAAASGGAGDDAADDADGPAAAAGASC